MSACTGSSRAKIDEEEEEKDDDDNDDNDEVEIVLKKEGKLRIMTTKEEVQDD